MWEPLCPCTWDIMALGSFCTERLQNRLWLSEMSPAMAAVCCYKFINFSWSLKWQCRNTEMETRENRGHYMRIFFAFFLRHLLLALVRKDILNRWGPLVIPKAWDDFFDVCFY